MVEDQEQKHCCRFCNKKFPCGRSLGGHMRSHMTVNSSETEEKFEKKKGPPLVPGGGINTSKNFSASFEGYGLRENPKKTWRLSGSSHASSQQGKACKECGKMFPSWKALFGHMRCHSERSAQEDSWSGGAGAAGGSGGDGSSKMVLDSQSDNEGVAPRRRRSRRARYGASPSSFSVANGSSSISEMEQEQEDVAISLMMLSRDVGSWGGINNSVAESSDNNSVVLEVRSSAIVKKKRESNKKRSEPGLSDDMSLRNLPRKVDSDDVSDDWLNRDGEFDENKLDYEVSDEEMVKDLLKLDYSHFKLGKNSSKKKVAELGRNLQKRIDFDRVGSSKRANYDSCETELGKEFSKKVKHEAAAAAAVNGIGKIPSKKNRFECTTCNKTFHSYQALGGHRASHKKVKGCFASKTEGSEASFEEEESSPEQALLSENKYNTCSIEKLIEAGESSEAQVKKVKGHECPICFKVFASGQALGGHKRSHLVSNSDIASRPENCQTIVIQQQLSEIPDLLDLNLPAPVEEDTSNGFKSWWVGANHKHEPLVGLISN
ncbi:hypothetical protein H6P81_019926 [Aristolochia fimbriata]|uniref:C2H2-type domain-containing protein n=1 Tax=Aristolochia fimbriata TaxID=158543 RepID=A0AAV7DUB7_ARIFI|nr:hypothetical protein H6P81_019926 [Aristolochia fimbriata]